MICYLIKTHSDKRPANDECQRKPGDSCVRQVELVPARPEAVPAEAAIPIPVQARAIILLKRDATALRAFSAARNLRIV